MGKWAMGKWVNGQWVYSLNVCNVAGNRQFVLIFKQYLFNWLQNVTSLIQTS